MHQFLTRMLSIRISFPIFQMFILYTLSMRVRNWFMHWACASGTDACTEHVRQELMRKLSIRVRNWCVHWAYASGTNACTERIPIKNAEHTHQELMRTLSIRVRNWCVCSAFASVPDAYPHHAHHAVSYAYAQRKHKNSKFERGPYKPCWACVRNWCACWAYASGTDAHAEQTHQFLTRMLSMRVRN